jgi:hypothetical protein
LRINLKVSGLDSFKESTEKSVEFRAIFRKTSGISLMETPFGEFVESTNRAMQDRAKMNLRASKQKMQVLMASYGLVK